jgi:hypothetical protein
MSKLDWAKDQRLRRRQRFGSEPIGQIDVSPSSTIVPHRSKKDKQAERRRAVGPVRLPKPPKVLIDPAELAVPDAYERFRLELAHLDQEIAGLEKQALLRRGRRAAVLAVLKKIAPPGKPYHVAKLIPAAEAANRKMRRRKKASAPTATKRGPRSL